MSPPMDIGKLHSPGSQSNKAGCKTYRLDGRLYADQWNENFRHLEGRFRSRFTKQDGMRLRNPWPFHAQSHSVKGAQTSAMEAQGVLADKRAILPRDRPRLTGVGPFEQPRHARFLCLAIFDFLRKTDTAVWLQRSIADDADPTVSAGGKYCCQVYVHRL